MYCTNCGSKLEKNEKYCTKCGEPCEKEKEIINQKNPTNNNDNIPIILGIVACILFWIPVFSIPLAIISIVLGIAQRKETHSSIGIILGIISIILTCMMVAAIIMLMSFATKNADKFIDDFQKDDNIFDDYNEYYNRQKAKDDIKGYSWSVNNDDGVIYLNQDHTYIWYEDDNNKEDNYEKGEYKTYEGKTALDYITNTLKEFGITEENFFKNEEDDINDYYLLILTSSEEKKKGEEFKEITNTKYYLGIYRKEEKIIDFINLTTKEKTIFTRKEKLSNIDV